VNELLQRPFYLFQHRLALARIGMIAVAGANALFAVARLLQELWSGTPTAWRCNLAGLLLALGLYHWYRHDPEARVTMAIHGTAVIATLCLLAPLLYGDASSIWWLSLIGLSMVLMTQRWVAFGWCLAVTVLMTTMPLLVANSPALARLDEPLLEATLSRLAFALVLFGIALAFRLLVRSQAQQLRETAAELAKSSQARDRFLKAMGHELRTPLHAVIALTDQALHQRLEPEQRARIVGAHASAMVLQRLVDDVLEFASGRDAAATLASETFSARDIVLETAAAWRPEAAAHGVDIAVDIAADWREPRVGDAARFRQIVDRLTGDALQGRHAGRIAIGLAPWHREPEGLQLTVAARGSANAALPSRGDAQAHDPAGLVLGLARVHDLSTRMGGRVEPLDTPEHGRRSTVYLAIAPAPGAERVDATAGMPASQPLVPAQRALHVLVCEDDEVCRELLIAGLTALGHRSAAVEDGEAGFARQQAERFDAILTDLNMPRLDGNDLLERIRAAEQVQRAPRIPIVAVTAHLGREDEHRILAHGFDGLLAKPFRLIDVQRMLQSLTPQVERRRAG
jgi:CheY-like chemotaxis protein/signal transduction histidine kinase